MIVWILEIYWNAYELQQNIIMIREYNINNFADKFTRKIKISIIAPINIFKGNKD